MDKWNIGRNELHFLSFFTCKEFCKGCSTKGANDCSQTNFKNALGKSL